MAVYLDPEVHERRAQWIKKQEQEKQKDQSNDVITQHVEWTFLQFTSLHRNFCVDRTLSQESGVAITCKAMQLLARRSPWQLPEAGWFHWGDDWRVRVVDHVGLEPANRRRVVVDSFMMNGQY